MRICLVSPEVFSWGYHGGFGFLTRSLGGEFARKGHRVCVVTVRSARAYGFPAHEGRPYVLSSVVSRLGSMGYYRDRLYIVISYGEETNFVISKFATFYHFHDIRIKGRNKSHYGIRRSSLMKDQTTTCCSGWVSRSPRYRPFL